MLFHEARNDQAFLKCGIMGFTGSGKTYTASVIARGLHKQIDSEAPVAFLDTETGSDWVRRYFVDDEIKLAVAKTRAFSDLTPAIREAEKAGSILIIDSISHFWRELTESYAVKKRRTQLLFQDWAWLKREWGQFTDCFVNSACHIIMCGRAGYEYDFFENEAGKKELEKTGIKMKAETETGYEPSLLILMTRKQEFDANNQEKTHNVRWATVLKDRGGLLDGKSFSNPSFEDFLPHIQQLNIGGKQLGVDTTRTSDEIIPPDDRGWQYDKEQKEIALDEIKELLAKHHPGAAAAAKKEKGDLLEKHLETRSWAMAQSLSLDELRKGRDTLWQDLEGRPYGFTKEQVEEAPF